jgi:hypothetical protein
MEELKTEFVQEKFSGPRKGFYYDQKLGGYMPAKPKVGKSDLTGGNTKLIILVAIGVIGILAYLFRDKLKALWLEKTK